MYSIPGDRRRREPRVTDGEGWFDSGPGRRGTAIVQKGDERRREEGWRQRVVVFEMIRPICASFPRCTPRRGKPARIPRHRKHRGSPVECHIFRRGWEERDSKTAWEEDRGQREEKEREGEEEGGTKKGGERGENTKGRGLQPYPATRG